MPESHDFTTAEGLRTRGRVSAHVLWDHLTRPTARQAGEIPWSADAITPEWLTPILCRDEPAAAVETATVFGGSTGSSVRRAVRVTYNAVGERAGLITAFFVKTTPTVLTRLSSAIAAVQEARFFQELRPELEVEAPIHRFSAYDKVSGRSFHMWEDLTVTRGARFCTWRDAMTIDQADKVVSTLAQLHGRYYASPRLDRDLRWIPAYERFHRTGERSGTRVGHEEAMTVAEGVIPPDVFARRDRIWPAAEAALAVHAAEPRTVIHSDVHLGNWYLAADGAVGLCDWQCLSTGHWARDVAYALSTVMDVPVRRQAERDLLQRYLERLHDFGGPKVDFETAWLRYRQQMFAALLMWTPTLRHPPTMPDMQPEEMSLEMIRRITAAISDLDSFGSVQD